MTSIRKSWMVCVGCGLLVTVIAQVMGPMFPTEGAGYSPGYGAPVFAFEMATSAEDLAKVFGTRDDPARERRILDMDRGNRWDFAFMFVYGAYLWTFFRAVRWESGRRAWWLFAWLGVLAALSDAVENVLLLDLTADLEAARHVEWVAYPVWTKFLLLMATSVAAGWYLVSRRSWVWSSLGLLTLCGGFVVLVARWSPSEYGRLLVNGLTISWVIQLVYAIVRTIRPVSVVQDSSTNRRR